METQDESSRLACERFPAGLFQPEGSYRFGLDALLLAHFASSWISIIREKEPQRAGTDLRFADLGTGCGAAGLSVLLHSFAVKGIGIDIDAELVAAARYNAGMLGLEDRFEPVEADIDDRNALKRLKKTFGSMDLVMVNPPWRLEGSGRVPSNPSRRRALFGTPQTLSQFATAAALLLRRGGRSLWICGVHRLFDLLAALTAASLNPSSLHFIHQNPESVAELVLVSGRLHGRDEIIVNPPYFIDTPSGKH